VYYLIELGKSAALRIWSVYTRLTQRCVSIFYLKWIENCLNSRTQRVVISSAESSWRLVTSGVPQGSVLGPALFNFFINDLHEGAACTRRKLSDDIKLGGAADTLAGRATIHWIGWRVGCRGT